MSAMPVASTPQVGAGGYRHPAPAATIVAGLTDGPAEPALSLERSYEICRRLHAAHGRTYYAATRLLPAVRRRHVHALYAFARYADDLVDHAGLDWSRPQRAAALAAWRADTHAALADGTSAHPVLHALAHTVATFGLRNDDVEAFLASMALDLTVMRYETYADLARYMHGSAAVIGGLMVPVLGAEPAARAPAMALGVAFQLSNFLRDVAEDWDRGRIYLPLEDLARFGVGEWDFRTRRVGPGFRRLFAFEIARARALYRQAEDGFALLPPASRRCIRVAHRLYGGILDAIEASDYQVFRVRASVSPVRKALVAARVLLAPAPSRAGAPP
jgi:15-cis-phytoene synthase